jgi:mono/diheme cytochrome c family protein
MAIKVVTTFAVAAMVVLAMSAGNAQAQAADKKTERLWKSKCSSCHGVDGDGNTEQGKKMKVVDMTTAAWQSKRSDEYIKKAIMEGTKKEEGGVKKEMDAYKDEINPDQLEALVKYIRALKK